MKCNHSNTQPYATGFLPYLGFIISLFLTSIPAFAADFMVTNSHSSGAGSFVDAVSASENNPGADTIRFDTSVFSSAKTITLASRLFISQELIIQGPGRDLLSFELENGANTLFGLFRVGFTSTASSPSLAVNDITIRVLNQTNSVERVFFVRDANLSLSNVTLIGSDSVMEDQSGAAIAIINGNLSMSQCRLENFHSRFRGGAVYGAYNKVQQSAFSIELDQCALVNNSVVGGKPGFPDFGGALYVEAEQPTNQVEVLIANSEFSENEAGKGGAISLISAGLQLSNSTVSGNYSRTLGGGLWFENPTPQFSLLPYITGSTISRNSSEIAGGGVAADDLNQKFVISSSVLAGNVAPIEPEFSQGDITASYSLIGDDNGDSAKVNFTEHNSAIGSVIVDTKPMLSALHNNGGNTRTHAVLTGSPLIDAGSTTSLPTAPNFSPYAYDQRGVGFARVTGSGADIGAFEKTSTAENNGGGEKQSAGGGSFGVLPIFAFLVLGYRTRKASLAELRVKGIVKAMGLVMFTSCFMLGCASQGYRYLPHEKQVNTPLENTVVVVNVGDSILHQARKYTYDAIELHAKVSRYFGCFNADSGWYIQTYVDGSFRYFKPANIRNNTARLFMGGGLCNGWVSSIKLDNDSGELCLNNNSLSNLCGSKDHFTHSSLDILDDESVQKTLIYNGLVGDKVNFSYHEKYTEQRQSLFSNSVEYDLSKSNIIGYKGAVIEVLDATNRYLKYKVIKHLD